MIIIASYSNVSVTYTANGTQTVFSFPFDYLRKAFVLVEVNEETILTQGTDYSVSNKTVVFTTAPTAGTVLRIYRQTDTKPLVSWADASVLRAKDMTVQQIQELHILEETQEWARDYAIIRDGSEWNARNFPIKNVGDPEDLKDAANKEYVDQLIAGIVAKGGNIVPFNNVSLMRASEDLVSGMYAFTAGYYEVNDGGSSVYTIRAKTQEDVDDGSFVIFLNNGNVAEWISQDNYLSYKDSNYAETYNTPVFKSYHQASVEWEAQKELDASENTLTIATYNTENECDQRCIGDISNIPLSKRLTVALMTKAQVIGFNESLNDGGVNAMDMYSNLGKFTDGIFAPIKPNVNGSPYTYGNMIQSALPLDSKTYALYPHVANVEDRGYAKVVFTLGGKTISVYSTHLGLNTTERSTHISSLFSTVQADTSDYKIVIGDMNTSDLSELQVFIDAGYTFVNTGQYPTYFHSNAIDHIICSPGISVIESGYIEDTLVPNTLNLGRLTKNAVSDHSPLWARLRFN